MGVLAEGLLYYDYGPPTSLASAIGVIVVHGGMYIRGTVGGRKFSFFVGGGDGIGIGKRSVYSVV